ncbi:MAG: PcfB family protein [Hungatella hathewayi]|nr:PcfB family protein [Hungatella hathewayi]
MEEDVTRRTVAISVQATKLTGRVLCKAFQKFLAEMQKQRRASLTPHGRQSVKQLMGQGVSSNSIQLKGDARLFDRIARKFNVDYAFHKVGPKDYLLFFKAGQADAITAAFSEYTKRVMARQKDRPSILGQLRQFGEHIKTRQKEREKTREAVQER